MAAASSSEEEHDHDATQDHNHSNVNFMAKQGGYTAPTSRLNPIARVLLIARTDDNCIWSKLGEISLIRHIWEYTMDFNRHCFNEFISDQETAFLSRFDTRHYRCPYIMKPVKFPEPTGININMMPFKLSRNISNFKATRLPDYVEPYFDMIGACHECEEPKRSTIAFLTINESMVHKGKTQRRPGLHVENAGNIVLKPEDLTEEEKQSLSVAADQHEQTLQFMQKNGEGVIQQRKIVKIGSFGQGHLSPTDGPKDGIYMASNVDASCQAWNCKIVENEEGEEVIGRYGDIEHLRRNLNERKIKKEIMKKNMLYWMTDRTPHEVLPMQETAYRQYFRLVTWNVAAWHEQHCTPNPNGVVPNPKITRIIKSSKF